MYHLMVKLYSCPRADCLALGVADFALFVHVVVPHSRCGLRAAAGRLRPARPLAWIWRHLELITVMMSQFAIVSDNCDCNCDIITTVLTYATTVSIP